MGGKIGKGKRLERKEIAGKVCVCVLSTYIKLQHYLAGTPFGARPKPLSSL